jgi:hypothetical protein
MRSMDGFVPNEQRVGNSRLQSPSEANECGIKAWEMAESSTCCEDPLQDLSKQLQFLLNSDHSHFRQNLGKDGLGEISSIHSDAASISSSGLDSEAWGPQSEDDRNSNASKRHRSKKVSFSPQGSRVDEDEVLDIRQNRLSAMRSEFRRIISEKSTSLRATEENCLVPQSNVASSPISIRILSGNYQPGEHKNRSEDPAKMFHLSEQNPNIHFASRKSTTACPSIPRTVQSAQSSSPSTPRLANDKRTGTIRSVSSPRKLASSPSNSSRREFEPSYADSPRTAMDSRHPRTPSRSGAPSCSGSSPAPSTPSRAHTSSAEPARAALPSTLAQTLANRAAAAQQRVDVARETLLREMALHGTASRSLVLND